MTVARLIFTLWLVAATATSTAAQVDAGWMRYPTLSPDGTTIAFTYRGDLYRVPSSGGTATQLTQHPAHDLMPVWSRDGTRLAFASDRHGNFDLYVIPAAGGSAQRLTFHSSAEYPYSFTPDDKSVVFGAARMDAAANRQYPAASMPELWTVPASGGRPVQLLTTPADDARYSRDGRLLMYTDNKGRENIWRKHHVSSVARDVWVYDATAGTHRQLTTFAGEDRQPVLADGDKAFYYLSEESGTFNVHKLPLAGGKSQQLTTFKGLPVRFLSIADDGALGFGHDGQLYTMKPGQPPRRVAVTIAADAKANGDLLLPVTGGARELAVAPSGKEVAFVFRGDVFVASIE
ncbi:MAG: S41 family peptidase, partial [Gemmatimonadaceae bacterium]